MYAGCGLILVLLASLHICFVFAHPSSSDTWSCSFQNDLCHWKVDETEAVDQNGTLTDRGWRIFNFHAGEKQIFYQTNIESPKFVYLEGHSEVRSELKSPAGIFKKKNSGVLLRFSFFMFNGSKLSLYSIQNNSYSLAWTSTPADNANPSEKNSTSLEGIWIKVSQCLPHLVTTNDLGYEKEIRIAFVGHVLENSSIGLRRLTALVLDSGCAPEMVLEEEKDDEGKTIEAAVEDDTVHVAWRFMVILSLFLCFGALFLATLVVVFGGVKTKITGRRAGWPSRTQNQSEFSNPSFQFQYQRLDAA